MTLKSTTNLSNINKERNPKSKHKQQNIKQEEILVKDTFRNKISYTNGSAGTRARPTKTMQAQMVGAKKTRPYNQMIFYSLSLMKQRW